MYRYNKCEYVLNVSVLFLISKQYVNIYKSLCMLGGMELWSIMLYAIAGDDTATLFYENTQ